MIEFITFADQYVDLKTWAIINLLAYGAIAVASPLFKNRSKQMASALKKFITLLIAVATVSASIFLDSLSGPIVRDSAQRVVIGALAAFFAYDYVIKYAILLAKALPGFVQRFTAPGGQHAR